MTSLDNAVTRHVRVGCELEVLLLVRPEFDVRIDTVPAIYRVDEYRLSR